MKMSINSLAFPAETPFDGMISQTTAAGFDGIELAMGSGRCVSFDTTETQCHSLVQHTQDAGLSISGVWIEQDTEVNYASPDARAQEDAVAKTIAALERATWLECDTVILSPGFVGRSGMTSPLVFYEDAYSRSLETLLKLRFTAQRHSVHIACRNGPNRFLLSPMEMRTFIDQINSPNVRVCLDLAALLSYGYPQDWIKSLGHRIVLIHVDDTILQQPDDQQEGARVEHLVDWPAIRAALQRINYPGPIVYRGRADDIANIHSRMEHRFCRSDG